VSTSVRQLVHQTNNRPPGIRGHRVPDEEETHHFPLVFFTSAVSRAWE
jgi:hypothetical protein